MINIVDQLFKVNKNKIWSRFDLHISEMRALANMQVQFDKENLELSGGKLREVMHQAANVAVHNYARYDLNDQH